MLSTRSISANAVRLVDEYNTSKKCNECKEGDCVTFLMRDDPRPYKKGQQRLVHGLLRCNICGCLWNRDVNGAKNILHVAQALLSGEDRPAYLRRQGSPNQPRFHDPVTLQ